MRAQAGKKARSWTRAPPTPAGSLYKNPAGSARSARRRRPDHPTRARARARVRAHVHSSCWFAFCAEDARARASAQLRRLFQGLIDPARRTSSGVDGAGRVVHRIWSAAAPSQAAWKSWPHLVHLTLASPTQESSHSGQIPATMTQRFARDVPRRGRLANSCGWRLRARRWPSQELAFVDKLWCCAEVLRSPADLGLRPRAAEMQSDAGVLQAASADFP